MYTVTKKLSSSTPSKEMLNSDLLIATPKNKRFSSGIKVSVLNPPSLRNSLQNLTPAAQSVPTIYETESFIVASNRASDDVVSGIVRHHGS